jgi:hypothetical protein
MAGISTFGYGDPSASERQFSAFELVWCLGGSFSFPFYFWGVQIFTVFFQIVEEKKEIKNQKD